MTPRPRKKGSKDLPDNLYSNKSKDKTYYRYKRPDGQFRSLGTDKNRAVTTAKKLNIYYSKDNRQKLIDRVIQSFRVCDFTKIFINEILPERDLAKGTLNNYINQLKEFDKRLGDRDINSIDIKTISDFLNSFPPTHSNRYYSILNLYFKYAKGRGYRVGENPLNDYIKKKAKKRRKRLTLEQYNAIYELAPQWLKNAMDLGLYTLQRRDDLLHMRFDHVKNSCIEVTQQKTGTTVRIEIGASLKEIIKRCRDNIHSPLLIHRLPEKLRQRNDQMRHHTSVTPDYLTKAFAKYRNMTGLFDEYDSGELPSFHEIRSLGIYLYDKAGLDAQSLAGHLSKEMTELYKDGHEVKIIMALADLKL